MYAIYRNIDIVITLNSNIYAQFLTEYLIFFVILWALLSLENSLPPQLRVSSQYHYLHHYIHHYLRLTLDLLARSLGHFLPINLKHRTGINSHQTLEHLEASHEQGFP